MRCEMNYVHLALVGVHVCESHCLWITKKDGFSSTDWGGLVILHQIIQGIEFYDPKEVLPWAINQHFQMLDTTFTPEVDKKTTKTKQNKNKHWNLK